MPVSSYTFDVGLPKRFDFVDTGKSGGSETFYDGKKLDPADVTITEASFGKMVTFASEHVPDESTTFISVFIPPLSFQSLPAGIYAISQAVISVRALSFAGGNPPVGQVVRNESVQLIGHASMTE